MSCSSSALRSCRVALVLIRVGAASEAEPAASAPNPMMD